MRPDYPDVATSLTIWRLSTESKPVRSWRADHSGCKNPHDTVPIAACPTLQPNLKDSPMYIRALAPFFYLTQLVLAQQPTPILPDPKLTPGDTFEVTAQDVCVPGYAKKVRAVPAWLKRQAYAEYGITQYRIGDYDSMIPDPLKGASNEDEIHVTWHKLRVHTGIQKRISPESVCAVMIFLPIYAFDNHLRYYLAHRQVYKK